MIVCRAEIPHRGSYAESGWTGERLLSRPGNSLLHFCAGFLIEALGDFLTHPGSQFGERLVLAVAFDLVRGTHVVALGMVAEAVGLDDFEVGPLFLPNPVYDRLEMIVEVLGISGIDFTAFDPEGLSPPQHASR